MHPSILVVGAQKAGATSPQYYLKENPDVCLPDRKETKFLVHDHIYLASNLAANRRAKLTEPGRCYMQTTFDRENRRLTSFLDRDLSHWQ